MTPSQLLYALETEGWVMTEGHSVVTNSLDAFKLEVGLRVRQSSDTVEAIDRRLAEACWVTMPFVDYLLSVARYGKQGEGVPT